MSIIRKSILSAQVLFIVVTAQSCILPPRGAPWPEPRSLEQIAEHEIKVNQVGYFPDRKKIATFTSDSKEPLEWRVEKKEKTVAKGTTCVHGHDADSGEHLHLIDFSDLNKVGKGFFLAVGNKRSFPFSISEDLYRELRRDAARYFFLNRSGFELEMPWVEDEKLERAAGHMSDRFAKCEPGNRCKTKKKDVLGGWYDAGDYGKYVVNGGMSAWLLMYTYEQLYMRNSSRTLPVDMNIPRSENTIPDILDEAGYEMEWILKMQVAKGDEMGLVHHRIRNTRFTALGHPPPEQNLEPPRYLQDTTTSATLNLAAAGALCARVYRKWKSELADRCLEAAETAWMAAKNNPSLKAEGTGHVPYRNPDVDDDFYWAAAELYITTKKDVYRRFLAGSPFFANPTMNAGGSASMFNWADTDGLGAIALATSDLAEDDELKKDHVEALLDFSDRLLDLTEKQGYRYPMAQRNYPWGSNSFVLNNALVLALSHRISGEDKYLNGATMAMDYILGRNPLDFSYVSGYGKFSMRFPHHRFFAPTYNEKLPFVPPGSVAGGPNTSMQDKSVKAYRAGCAPAKCYVDSVESFSTNEVAINWNAALFAVSAFLDEEAH